MKENKKSHHKVQTDPNIKYVNKKRFRKGRMTKIKNWYYDNIKKHSSVLINMELNNGYHRHFMVTEDQNGFKYCKKFYLFDNDLKYYDIDSKIWTYDFHENYSLPVKRIIPIKEILDTIHTGQITEIEYSSNPSTLEHAMNNKIAEGILKGAELSGFFKQIRLLLIITMLVVIINFLLSLKTSGLLDAIGNAI